MPVVATTPTRTPFYDKDSPPVVENTIVTTSIVSSIYVFFLWVGAWGCVDTIIEMLTDVPLYQLAMYFGVLVAASVLLWLQLADWRQAQEDEDEFRV